MTIKRNDIFHGGQTKEIHFQHADLPLLRLINEGGLGSQVMGTRTGLQLLNSQRASASVPILDNNS